MRFSVVVTSFNKAKLLRHTLNSFRHQTVRDFEVIVADDGSRDESEAVALDFAASPACNYPLSFVRQEDKGWRASAVRNLGATLAQGLYLVFIDGDQVCDRGLLLAYARAVDRGARGAAGLRHYINNSPDEEPDKVLADMGVGIFDTRFLHTHADEGIIPFDLAWSCNCMVEREIWDRIGGFDESFPGWGGEDTDFFARVHRSGHPIFGCRDSHVFHFPETRTSVNAAGSRYWYAEKINDMSIQRNGGRHVKSLRAQGERRWLHVEG